MSEMKTAVVGGIEREIVDIEGLPFVEIGGDTVQFYPQSKDVLGVKFVEGEQYENWFGTYRVRYIRTDGTMDVEYVSVKRVDVYVGERVTYPMKAQAQAILAFSRECEAEMRRDRVVEVDVQNGLVAWLMRNGTVHGQANPKALDAFVERYERLSGAKVDMRYVQLGNYWSYALAVDAPVIPSHLMSEIPGNVKVLENNGRVSMWSVEWVSGLIKAGMRLGKQGGEQAQAA